MVFVRKVGNGSDVTTKWIEESFVPVSCHCVDVFLISSFKFT